MTKKVCVIGAGIIGTTTALRVKQAFPDLDLDLIADKFSPITTSDGVAGYWQPHLNPGTPDEKVL